MRNVRRIGLSAVSPYKMKKAQGMPINTVIIAILALLVLAVVAFIFIRQNRDINNGLGNCETRGGECVNGEGPNDDQCPSGYNGVFGGTCEGDQICCASLT